MLQTHQIVSIDTEFPRLVHNTPGGANLFACYEDVKFNVAKSILFQASVTLSDDSGDISGTWQYNLVYGAMVVDYVNCLRSEYRAIKFVKMPWLTYGVPHMIFAERFSDVVQNYHGKARWVTFHGLYDLAHLVPLFTGQPLPDSVFDFILLIASWFGRVYDLKSMVGVNHVGRAHQAGSDSLVTAFNKFTTIFYRLRRSNPSGCVLDLEGFIYNISTKVVSPNNKDHDHRIDTNQLILVSYIFHSLLIV